MEKADKLKDMAIKIVGFKVGVARAVYYKRLENPNDKELGKHMNLAFRSYKCDFVSVRKVDPLQRK